VLFLLSVPAARNSLGTFLMLVTGGRPIFGSGGMHHRIDAISRLRQAA
jgi:hypothetical protein